MPHEPPPTTTIFTRVILTPLIVERRIQDALRHHAPRGRDTEQIGPFLATFTRDTANPYLNYAIPDEGGTATPDDVQALVDAYRARERRQIAALARIVDTRLREILRYASLSRHPSAAGR